MSTYPLEWGWHHQPEATKTSATSGPPRETLLGRKPREAGDELAQAWGDLRCQRCTDPGMTGAYRVEGKILCWRCAVKSLGVENAPGREQSETLAPLILKRK